jgi:hypothetical protein
MSWDGSTSRLYVGGDLVDSTTNSDVGDLDSTADFEAIGGKEGSGNPTYGKICDFRIYNRALSLEEIQTLYEWGNGDYASPPNDRTDSSSAVSRWRFDGDVTDSWGSNDGTVQGDIGFTGGIRDQAAKFSGDDYVDTGITDLGSSFSLSAWTNLENNSPSKNRIFGKWNDIDGYDIILDANNDSYRIVIDTDSGADVLKGGSTTSRGWKHVLCSWDGTTARLYVNGVLKGSLTPNSYNSSNDRLAISAFKSDRRFKGRIDDARFYSRALEPNEVFQLYQWGTRGRDMRKLTVNKT